MSKRLKIKLFSLPVLVAIQEILTSLGVQQIPPNFLRELVGLSAKKLFFENIKLHFVLIKKYTHLKKNSTILDVGSGCGSYALYFQKYLNNHGQYEGFDIFPALIFWCKRVIENTDTRFHFRLAPLFNKNYNPEGKIKAKDYIFPYPSDYFDLAIAMSVFTHLTKFDAENYIKQSARVIKAGGYAIFTFFLLNEVSKKSIKKGIAALDFSIKTSNVSKTPYRDNPELAIAYNQNYIFNLYKKEGFSIEKVLYGNWSKTNKAKNYQDVIVAKKLY